MRIGHGFDAHALAPGDSLILGGERIACERSIEAHSDGDVIVHAVCDALLGALALGDLGTHFPDSDPALENIDSRQLLRDVVRRVMDAGYVPANVDVTVVAAIPKIAAHRQAIVRNLSDDLQIDESRLSVKATTTDGLGYTGRAEGIAVHAVVLVVEQS